MRVWLSLSQRGTKAESQELHRRLSGRFRRDGGMGLLRCWSKLRLQLMHSVLQLRVLILGCF
jgi:hypothetical protein